MRRSTSSGRSSSPPGSGSSSSTVSPPSRRALLAAGAPSRRTSPAAISRSATLRDPISGSSARKRSSREPAAESGTVKRGVGHRPRARPLALREQQRGEQDEHAEHDERVGQVERGPELDVEEVGHVSEPNTVKQVRGAAADQEPERDREDRV